MISLHGGDDDDNDDDDDDFNDFKITIFNGLGFLLHFKVFSDRKIFEYCYVLSHSVILQNFKNRGGMSPRHPH